jgi:thiol:disulfide interchange protein
MNVLLKQMRRLSDFYSTMLLCIFCLVLALHSNAQIFIPGDTDTALGSVNSANTGTSNFAQDSNKITRVNMYVVAKDLNSPKSKVQVADTTLNNPFSTLYWDAFKRQVDSLKRPYYIDFSATWCGPCKALDNTVFNDPRVIEITQRGMLAKKIDVDDFDGIGVTETFKITSLPTVVFFDSSGKIKNRVEGLYTVDYFLDILKRLH